MKQLRPIVALALVAGVLAIAITWSVRNPAGFTTPFECLEAYREACLAGDGAGQLRCLAEALRKEMQQQFPDPASLGEWNRVRLADVVSWTAHEPQRTTDGSEVLVDVEEIRRTSRRLVRFHLRQVGRGWLITAIEPPRDLPNPIPFGTHISQPVDGQSSNPAASGLVGDPHR